MKELREAEGDQENRKERDRKRIHLGFGCTFSVVMAARWEGEEERVIGQCEGPTTVGRQQPRRGGRSRGEGRTCGTTRADARHVSESTADTRGLFNPTLEHLHRVQSFGGHVSSEAAISTRAMLCRMARKPHFQHSR